MLLVCSHKAPRPVTSQSVLQNCCPTDPQIMPCTDACLLSPARIPQSITVAASDKSDMRWAESNYGTCVDLYAPGVDITSSMFTSDTAIITATGTSMACPHVSGVAAQYLQVVTCVLTDLPSME